MDRKAVDRSLVRLGIVAEKHLPDVCVEFELALAVKRFGVMKVLNRVFQQWKFDVWYRL